LTIPRISCIAILVASFLTFAAAQQPPKPEPALDVTSMDRSVDPCADFFQYSCGGWLKKNPIPPDQSSWDTYSKMQDENTARLRGILEEAAAGGAQRNPITQKIGDYYASCMDEKTVDAAGLKPLQPYLDAIAGLRAKADLAQVAADAAYTSHYRRSTFFFFGSDQDAKDSTQVIAEAFQGGLGLPDRDYYTKDDPKSQELRKQYLAHVQKMFELLGDKPETAAAESQTVMRIETALAQGSMTRVELRDPQKIYHKMTAAELQTLAPNFQWATYFTKTGLPSLASLNVATPGFFKALSEEIDKEDLPSWKTYLRWHVVHAAAQHLSSVYVNTDFDFFGKTLQGTQQIEPLWKRCSKRVDNQLGEALGQAYVEKYFSAEAKQKALTMVKEIEAAMEQDINALPWMSAATKPRALEKLHAVANKIGYPEKWRDYSQLQIVRGDALGNVFAPINSNSTASLQRSASPSIAASGA